MDVTRSALIVDDDPAMRVLLRENLEALGIEVTEATDAPGLLAAAGERIPDILVTDVNMPGSYNGLAALDRLRDDPRYKSLPAIVLTGLERGEFNVRIDERNTWVYRKPPDWARFRSHVAALLGLSEPADLSALPPPDAPATPAPVRINGTVLIVEDEEPVQVLLAAKLKLAGYYSYVAATPELAFMQATAVDPDLIIMDIELGPGSTGVDAARWMRRSARLKTVPIILLTGLPAEKAHRLIPAGLENAALMFKPPDWPVLLDTVAKAIAGRKKSA